MMALAETGNCVPPEWGTERIVQVQDEGRTLVFYGLFALRCEKGQWLGALREENGNFSAFQSFAAPSLYWLCGPSSTYHQSPITPGFFPPENAAAKGLDLSEFPLLPVMVKGNASASKKASFINPELVSRRIYELTGVRKGDPSFMKGKDGFEIPHLHDRPISKAIHQHSPPGTLLGLAIRTFPFAPMLHLGHLVWVWHHLPAILHWKEKSSRHLALLPFIPSSHHFEEDLFTPSRWAHPAPPANMEPLTDNVAQWLLVDAPSSVLGTLAALGPSLPEVARILYMGKVHTRPPCIQQTLARWMSFPVLRERLELPAGPNYHDKHIPSLRLVGDWLLLLSEESGKSPAQTLKEERSHAEKAFYSLMKSPGIPSLDSLPPDPQDPSAWKPRLAAITSRRALDQAVPPAPSVAVASRPRRL